MASSAFVSVLGLIVKINAYISVDVAYINAGLVGNAEELRVAVDFLLSTVVSGLCSDRLGDLAEVARARRVSVVGVLRHPLYDVDGVKRSLVLERPLVTRRLRRVYACSPPWLRSH